MLKSISQLEKSDMNSKFRYLLNKKNTFIINKYYIDYLCDIEIILKTTN